MTVENKHLTEIGAGSFIGSNSSLVAPIKIGAGAYVGSGSVVTMDVPDDALAIARARQETKPGRAHRLREKIAAIKALKKQAQSLTAGTGLGYAVSRKLSGRNTLGHWS
jgi:bifunctional UDP-N-acetylglucosamine pyrophosphorylase/glucosamine-1-phosphate N-acetyltransferase